MDGWNKRKPHRQVNGYKISDANDRKINWRQWRFFCFLSKFWNYYSPFDDAGRRTVWPDLANFRHFGNILSILGNVLKVYFVFGKPLNLLWQILNAIGLIFIDVNGQMLKYYLAIWSHCHWASQRIKCRHKKVGGGYEVSKSIFCFQPLA